MTDPAASPTPAVSIAGLSKRFGGKPAVAGVSFDVPVGSVFGLLGHNGAGKSTTLGVLLGQVFPDAGQVRIHGHDVFTHRADALGRVGAIFEAPAFYDYLSGWRNLVVLSRYSGRVTRQALRDAVDFVGLNDRIQDPVGSYSHGMRQRLAVAQALLPKPDLLLLDEPTDGLDPEGIHRMRELVRQLHAEHGMTIVFSSHLLHEVEQLCTHAAVLKASKLVFCDAISNAGADTRYLRLDCDRRGDAAALLQQRGWAHAEGDRLRLADDADPAAVNAALVHAGFHVAAFAPERMSLEDFYLKHLQKTASDEATDAASGPAPQEATA